VLRRSTGPDRMNRGHRRRYVLFFATATVIGAFIFLYRVRPFVGITFGSTAIVLAVLAHLGILAGVVGPFLAWRRRLNKSR
jgi:uncharacterized membrane protein